MTHTPVWYIPSRHQQLLILWSWWARVQQDPEGGVKLCCQWQKYCPHVYGDKLSYNLPPWGWRGLRRIAEWPTQSCATLPPSPGRQQEWAAPLHQIWQSSLHEGIDNIHNYQRNYNASLKNLVFSMTPTCTQFDMIQQLRFEVSCKCWASNLNRKL